MFFQPNVSVFIIPASFQSCLIVWRFFSRGNHSVDSIFVMVFHLTFHKMFFHVPAWFYNYTFNNHIIMYHYTLWPIVEYLNRFQYFPFAKNAKCTCLHVRFFSLSFFDFIAIRNHTKLCQGLWTFPRLLIRKAIFFTKTVISIYIDASNI